MKIEIGDAVSEDVEFIVALLRDDEIGSSRELPWETDGSLYRRAFQNIVNSPFVDLVVARVSDRVAGCLHLAYIPGLSFGGATRCLIEDVRVANDLRRMGIGRALLLEGERRARQRGCLLVELFVSQNRSVALQFYESLGYAAAHRGLRKILK